MFVYLCSFKQTDGWGWGYTQGSFNMNFSICTNSFPLPSTKRSILHLNLKIVRFLSVTQKQQCIQPNTFDFAKICIQHSAACLFTVQSAAGNSRPTSHLIVANAPPVFCPFQLYAPLRTTNKTEAMPRNNLQEGISLRVDTRQRRQISGWQRKNFDVQQYVHVA